MQDNKKQLSMKNSTEEKEELKQDSKKYYTSENLEDDSSISNSPHSKLSKEVDEINYINQNNKQLLHTQYLHNQREMYEKFMETNKQRQGENQNQDKDQISNCYKKFIQISDKNPQDYLRIDKTNYQNQNEIKNIKPKHKVYKRRSSIFIDQSAISKQNLQYESENLKKHQLEVTNIQNEYLRWHREVLQPRRNKEGYCCKRKRRKVNLSIFQRVIYEQLLEGPNMGIPKYLLWKRVKTILNASNCFQVLTRIVNRYRMNVKKIKDKNIDELKNFLIIRANRRRKNQFINEDMKKFLTIVQLPSKTKKTSSRDALMNAQLDSKELENIPKYILYPYSRFRSTWDIIMIIFVIYNVMLLPMMIGLNFEEDNFREKIEIFVDIFFGCDIILNFFTGYIDDNNKLIMNQKQIANHYFKVWFWIDLFATFPFELIIPLLGMNAGEHIQLLRLLKTPRLFRIGRILKFLENMQGANIMRIVRLFLFFFMLAHWVGCFWYFIADDEQAEAKFEGEFRRKYIYALFNGLLILVGEAIKSNRPAEKIFIVIAMMVGQAISATIFGSMANLIKNMDQGHDIFTSKMDYINEHLRYYNIPEDISEDIRQYYDYIWLRHRELIYGKEHFKHLSQKLEQNIQKFRYQVLVQQLDIMRNVNDIFISRFLILLKPQIITPGEVIFYEGGISKGLYILEKGTIELFSNETKQLYKKVTPVDYFGLEVLMTKTARHWCTALSRNYSDLHVIEREQFEQLLEEFPKESYKLRRIAIGLMEKYQILTNQKLFSMISKHSSKSVGNNYETSYTRTNIFVKASWSSNYRKLQQALQIIKKGDDQKSFNTEEEAEEYAQKQLKKELKYLKQQEVMTNCDSDSQEEVYTKHQIQSFQTKINHLLNQSMNLQSEFLQCKVDEILIMFEDRLEKIQKIGLAQEFQEL